MVRLDECEKRALKKALQGFKGEVYRDNPFFKAILKNAKRIDPEKL